MQTSSTINTCKIAFYSSIMGDKIIIFALDLLFFTSLESRKSPLYDSIQHIMLSGFKIISSLTTQSRQEFGKKLDGNLLFISCLTCHGLGIAARIFTDSIYLKSRYSWLCISVQIMCVYYVIFRDNIIYSPLTPAWCS